MKYYYTFWKAQKDSLEEAKLLMDEELLTNKRKAFKRAKELALDIVIGRDNQVILLRRVEMGSDMCLQWVFDPVEL